ncbi:MAG TPA: phage portal protein [Armatimonadota bacterium]|jgi:PBSX family phage portal protein
MADQGLQAFVLGGSAGVSRQLPESVWSELYAGGAVVEPPYDLEALAGLYETNATHKACVDAKTINICGLGYRFVARKGAVVADASQREALENLFATCNPDQTFTEVMRMVWTDVECLGNGYLEVTRSSLGEIDGFYHVPATTVRVRGDGAGFLQIRGAEQRAFRQLGGAEAVDPNTGAPQNEILHLKKYTPESGYYGVPDIVAALPAVVGDKAAREYNIDFFSNHAVPRLAVIVEGGQLSDDVLAQIQDYMETEIKGQGHKTLVLDVPGNDVHIRLEPLTVGVSQDAAFLEYRKANRDEILMVHRVPPSKITVVEHANLANAQDQDSTFREQVVRPEQRRLEYRLNRMISEQMGISDWRFRFEEMDLSEAREEAEIAQIYHGIGAWTVEEIRARQGLGGE